MTRGRRAAVEWITEVRQAAEDLNQLTGEETVSFVHVHSAPGMRASADAFQRSLADLEADDRFRAEIVIRALRRLLADLSRRQEISQPHHRTCCRR